VLRESTIFGAFERTPKPLEGLVLGDSGYMLRDWLMTPILNPTTPIQRAYNDAHCATRVAIERTFGVCKRRWHCLHGELRVQPDMACRIITVCMILHNKATEIGLPLLDEQDDRYDEAAVDLPPPNLQDNPTERVRLVAGKAVRDTLLHNYFTR